MRNRFLFLFRYLRMYTFSYLIGIVFIILTNWIAVTLPEYLKLSVDLLSKGTRDIQSNQSKLMEYLLIMLGLAISIILVRSLSRIFFFNPGRAIEYRIKNDLFEILTHQRKEYYDKTTSGAVISKIQNDINGVRLICGFGMMQIFNITTALSFTPYKMYLLSPDLTLYTVFPILFVFIVIRVGMHFVVKYTRRRMVVLQTLSSFIVSSLSGLDVIKGSILQSWAGKRFKIHNRDLLRLSIKTSFFRSFLFPILHNLENILKVLILFVGGAYVIQSTLSIGELTAFISYSALLSMPVMGLGWLTTIFETGLIGLASLETIFAKPIPLSHIRPLPSRDRRQLFSRGIRVQHLTYSYPGQDKPVLDDISFSIEPDKIVGIMGKIGSGKSTLVNCLNKYLLVDRGTVLLNDLDIRDISDSDIRSVVRTVSQEPFLFSDTIRNNILFGAVENTNPSTGRIWEVVEDAALKTEIDRLPEGLDTLVGERGIMLSGGQKQRISLARAMMAPFDLLVLDDILSAVDYETERFLLERIYQKKTSRSLLIVSHRVQALANADLILVLDDGKIVARGTHQELISQPGMYKDTWRLQQQTDERKSE